MANGNDDANDGFGNETGQPVDPNVLIANGEQFDPNIHSIGDDGKPRLTRTGAFRRKRGAGARRSGQASTPRNIPVSSFAASLVFVHGALAGALRAPEFAISDDEGKTLAGAIADVQAHYGAVIDPKMQAWINLAIIAGTMYVPRALALRMRVQAEKEFARNNQPTLEDALATTHAEPPAPGFEFDFTTPPPGA